MPAQRSVAHPTKNFEMYGLASFEAGTISDRSSSSSVKLSCCSILGTSAAEMKKLAALMSAALALSPPPFPAPSDQPPLYQGPFRRAA